MISFSPGALSSAVIWETPSPPMAPETLSESPAQCLRPPPIPDSEACAHLREEPSVQLESSPTGVKRRGAIAALPAALAAGRAVSVAAAWRSSVSPTRSDDGSP